MSPKRLAIPALILVSVVAAGAGVARLAFQAAMPPKTTPTGKVITPAGTPTEVGSFPVNMVLTPDGKYAISTNTGFREQLSVIDTQTGALVDKVEFNGSGRREKQGLYFGIACHQAAGSTLVAVSRGDQDAISLYNLGSDGHLAAASEIDLPTTDNPLHLPRCIAGVAWNADGSRLYAVANQSHAFNGFRGSVLTIDAASHAILQEEKVGEFPLDILSTPSGVFVANEGSEGISILGGREVRTGTGPAYLASDHAGRTIFASNTQSDTVTFVNASTGRVERTVLLRLPGTDRLPGATPLGMAVSPDDKTLFVAMGDLSAVAVVDIRSGEVRGYIPAGWYPTALALSPDGHNLLVSNAKGVQNQNPNGHNVHGLGTYAPNIIEGTVNMVDLGQAMTNLASSTQQVVANNSNPDRPHGEPAMNPGIKHIVYIIKENRTYDQVFGDIPQGNGDPSLVEFGQNVTPNQHALAQRFALLDNFYVCAEVSADGWNWSTSGLANAYNERNVFYNYSGRGRSYDQEGTNNGSPVSLMGRRDVGEAAGGYIWDAFIKKGLSVRDYGMFNSDGEDAKGPDGKPIAIENRPTKPDLVNRTCIDYRDFDMAFCDSDAWVKLGLKPFPKQVTAYGSHNDPSRFTTWDREFRDYVKNGNLPALNLLRLPRNHTSGTAPGMSTPRSMVTDNDYAVGEIVDEISHSPYWSSTAIFIVEDDAQAGTDHVDCHRSPVLVISPFVRPGTVDSSYYNTDSVLATMEGLMGVPPHNQYLASARLLKVLGTSASNAAPYSAVMPDRDLLAAVNTERDYRARDSARLFSRFHEDSDADTQLNDILWKSIKGVGVPHPQTPGAMWGVH